MALLLVGASVAPAAADAAAHPSAPARIQAFLLTGAPDSFADLQAHVGSIEVLYPTYFECEIGSGQIVGDDEPAIDAYALAHRLPLMPRFDCQDGATVHLLLSDPSLRAQTLSGLVALARNPAYAGLSLDLENDGAADRSALSSFVLALARRLHAIGRKLTVVVDGVTRDEPRRSTGFYDDRTLAAIADRVFVLGWGVHWAGSAAGPIAPLPWVRAVVAYLASLPHATRFVFGAPMYGLDWAGGESSAAAGAAPSETRSNPSPPGEAAAYQYANVVALLHSVKGKPLRDRSADELTFAYKRAGIGHRVWYLDAHAIRDRLELARAAGMAIGVWRLGNEDQRLWSGGL
jgi:spore germination protein YaaH